MRKIKSQFNLKQMDFLSDFGEKVFGEFFKQHVESPYWKVKYSS